MSKPQIVSENLLAKWKVVTGRQKIEGHLAEFIRQQDPEGKLGSNELAGKILDFLESTNKPAH